MQVGGKGRTNQKGGAKRSLPGKNNGKSGEKKVCPTARPWGGSCRKDELPVWTKVQKRVDLKKVRDMTRGGGAKGGGTNLEKRRTGGEGQANGLEVPPPRLTINLGSSGGGKNPPWGGK